jgi:putative colanic acid biosynthesis UDP-glucose lipid carrier transferase
MKSKVGRYSKFLKPITVALDLIVLNLIAFYVFQNIFYSKYFLLLVSFTWIITAINVSFYEVYRFTKIISILNKSAKQFILFTIICYSFLGFYNKSENSKIMFCYLALVFFVIIFIKLSIYYSLKKYRTFFRGNVRNVLIIGNGENANLLNDLFNNNKDYGCHVVNRILLESNKLNQLDKILEVSSVKNIDVVYASLVGLTNSEINKLINFSENNLKILKFLPENDELLFSNNKMEYYDYIPIVSIQQTYLDDPITKLIKRIFDVFFSIFVMIFLLSWLIPILAILIKLESKGPVFFKQGRPGINEKEFFCYKFRSMKINETTEIEASKNDPRVTRIGRFIRKTSIDEMPQFLNVLIGEMSVVGPRPHLWSQNKVYGSRINKYMMRHHVKPGITGLAQVKGFRGEIESDEEMKNRINYDVFYIENWSLLMDIKIIIQTVINIFKGDEKAY